MEEEAKNGGSIPLLFSNRGLEYRLDRAIDLRARRRVEVRGELSRGGPNAEQEDDSQRCISRHI